MVFTQCCFFYCTINFQDRKKKKKTDDLLYEFNTISDLVSNKHHLSVPLLATVKPSAALMQTINSKVWISSFTLTS